MIPILLAVVAIALSARTSPAQPFTRINDPAIAALVDTCSSASWVDADDDGDLDLFVTTWSSLTPNVLFLNDGAGAFTRALLPDLDAQPRETFGSTWADADNDGSPDLFTSQLFNDGGILYRGNGAGGLTRIGGALVTGNTIKGQGAWADFDLDGDVDLVLACLNGTGGITTPNRLFLNQGGLVFTERDTGSLAGIVDTHHTAAWADYDNDGDPDLFFATGGVGSTKKDRIWRNMVKETGNAFLFPVTTGALANDLHDAQVITWADIDNDRDLDAYVINYTTLPNFLYRNDGGGTFTRLLAAGAIVTNTGLAHGAAWGDYDNDGDLDVYVARDGNQVNRLYTNNNDGTFGSVVAGEFVTLGRSNWNAVAGDYDRDGDLDLFAPVRDAVGPGMLYRNDLATGAHWFELHLVGVQSNRAGIGARVRVLATVGGSPRWQMREISASTGYGGHNMLDAHFGLGDAAVIDSLVCEWPSGQRDVLIDVVVDTLRTLVEGLGFTDAPPLPERSAVLHFSGAAPNPVRGTVRWTFELARAARVRLDLFDLAGRHRARLAEESLAPGAHAWSTPLPKGLAAGVYFAVLSGPGPAQSRRITILP